MADPTTVERPSVAMLPELALGGRHEDWISFTDVYDELDAGQVEAAVKMLEPIFANVEKALHARIDALEAEVRALKGR